MGMGRPSMLYAGGTLVPFAGKHSAENAGVTQAPNTTLTVRRNFRRAVLGCAVVDERWVNMMLLQRDTQAVDGST